MLWQIDRALVEAGHRSIVVAPRGSTSAGELTALDPVPAPLTEETLRDRRAACARVVDTVLREQHVDVVHFHGVDCDEYLPDRVDVPVVVTLHLWPDRHPAALLANRRPNVHLVCVSDAQRAACPKEASARTIRNGVDLSALVPRADGPRRDVLLLGRISPEKGFHLAVDAAARAGLRVTMAGAVFPYHSHREYFDYVIAPRLSESVRFLGPVGFDRKRELLRSALCLAVPSILPETSSLVAMEALACGTPVVALRSPALEELIEEGQTGWLVRTEDEMADAFTRVRALSRDACRRAAEACCDLRAMTGAYLTLYQELAAA